MLKKFIITNLFISLLSFNIINIKAYDYIDSSNEDPIRNLIVEIYDSKEQYEDLAGKPQENIIINSATNSAYWWPVGSEETTEVSGKVFATSAPQTTNITSHFGYREDPFGRGTKFHSGLDVSGGHAAGVVNIIAARDGIVVYPTADVANDCPSSNSLSNCGGGYGNYVIIQHSDGNYTLYGHLYEKSITVVAGDSVSQGQVIAKMGSSGNSTGTHIHFEVREGQNAYSATVDPLGYVSADDPRPSFTGDNEFIAWLSSWEGHTKEDGDYYIVEDLGDGVTTVGPGVTLENNVELFKQHGINVDDYPVGNKIKKGTIDQMVLEISNSRRTYVEGVLADNSIELNEYQIQALVSQMYNIGNIFGFSEAYKKYGNTNDLYENWFFRGIRKGTQFEAGLTRRRNSEWALFNLGEYVYNE